MNKRDGLRPLGDHADGYGVDFEVRLPFNVPPSVTRWDIRGLTDPETKAFAGAMMALVFLYNGQLQGLSDEATIEEVNLGSLAVQRKGIDLLRQRKDWPEPFMEWTNLGTFAREGSDAVELLDWWYEAAGARLERQAQERETRRQRRLDSRRSIEAPAAGAMGSLCLRCGKRPRHFDDLCKRCANDLGVRPTGAV